jgi:hypothetical protein
MRAKRPGGILHDTDAALDRFGRPFSLDTQAVVQMGNGLLADGEEYCHRNDQADDEDGKRAVTSRAALVPLSRCRQWMALRRKTALVLWFARTDVRHSSAFH